ncbi:metal ABC transporter solute-binding protein, Zn/Mn family [Euzebya sp.]|uniref:metal ABC transporter solute-binding protein, Zn/Mn family n=1 Tax=Euzebya sp. TaxID=1971409 RepID=UPI003515F11C
MPRLPRTAIPVALLVLLVLTLAACGGGEATPSPSGDAAQDGRPSIVVTTTVLGDVVGQLVQQDADVEVLLPVGADAHAFTPSAAQAEAVRAADLLVTNGGDLEEGLLDAIEAAEEDGVRVVHALDHVDVIEFGADDDHAEAPEDGHEDGHDHDGADPHFWTDPLRMADVVTALGEALADSDDRDIDWAARADDLAGQLEAVDAEVVEILDAVPDARRRLVTNHDALGYFADRYGFEVVATVIPGATTLAEPSAADLDEVVHAIEEAGVPAIFAETSAAPRLAEVVAQEVGGDVEVVTLHTESLSEPDGPAATYEDLLRSNATAIAEALG